MPDSQTKLRVFTAGTASLLLSAFVLMSASPALWPGSSLSKAMRFAFAPLCHQLEARSFTFAGATMCVCTRCFGIYLGLALGAWAAFALATLRHKVPLTSMWWWGAVSLPMFVQWVTGWVSPGMDDPMLRFITGFVFGLFAGASLITALRGDSQLVDG